jgi:hypothetical protein
MAQLGSFLRSEHYQQGNIRRVPHAGNGAPMKQVAEQPVTVPSHGD